MHLWPTVVLAAAVLCLAGAVAGAARGVGRRTTLLGLAGAAVLGGWATSLHQDAVADAERAEFVNVLEDEYGVSISETGDDLGEPSTWVIDGTPWTCYVPWGEYSFEQRMMCSNDGESFAEPSARTP